MSKPVIVESHMSPSGRSAWVRTSKRKTPFPVTTILGRAPWNKSRTKLKVPPALRGYFVTWLTPKGTSWYSPDPSKMRGAGNCGGAGAP